MNRTFAPLYHPEWPEHFQLLMFTVDPITGAEGVFRMSTEGVWEPFELNGTSLGDPLPIDTAAL
jgi:hypothetical protein